MLPTDDWGKTFQKCQKIAALFLIKSTHSPLSKQKTRKKISCRIKKNTLGRIPRFEEVEKLFAAPQWTNGRSGARRVELVVAGFRVAASDSTANPGCHPSFYWTNSHAVLHPPFSLFLGDKWMKLDEIDCDSRLERRPFTTYTWLFFPPRNSYFLSGIQANLHTLNLPLLYWLRGVREAFRFPGDSAVYYYCRGDHTL